ncbi:hypothetical protein CBOM_02593 [Ceraceosorus bombacis]|uniref:Uncharacterized protein n=1 Tax=Ceraceosorus bombacis TaxID=401625 RepID=A0A0P1BFP1_9BASI|nr:hypothetical protein CBOM_02593 [Ceraceosorus bombacis]
MSKEHMTLPLGDEKHDPINGHGGLRPSVGTPGASGMGASGPSNPSSGGILPGGVAKQEKKIHPVAIIGLWIALSSSVIVYNKASDQRLTEAQAAINGGLRIGSFELAAVPACKPVVVT